MRGSDLLVDMLLAYGVKHVFGLPGNQSYPLYDSLHARSDRIQHILMRDERSAAYAADAYARVTGKVGVCDAMLGPGALKLPSGLAEAYNSSTALLALIGDAPAGVQNLIDRGCVAQAADHLPALAAVSKWVVRTPALARLPQVLRQAFAHAATGRPGPVAVSVPSNILTAEVVEPPASYAFRPHGRFPAARAYPDPVDVEAAADLLRSAQRPLLVAGGGAAIAGAQEEVRALAEHFMLPVATTVNGRGILPDDHPLFVGVLGSQYASEAANQVAQAADLVFLVGCKSSQQTTFRWTLPAETQQVIHLDVDGTEIGKVFRTDVGLVADARAGLEALLQLARAQTLARRRPTPWAAESQARRAAWEAELEAEVQAAAAPIKPQYLMAELRRRLGPDDTFVTDASQSIGWAVNYMRVLRPGRSHLFPRGSATLGFGLPAAIGARLARPQGRVVVIAGDGGFTYGLAELSTLAKYDLNVTVVVLNNGALALNRFDEYLNYRRDYRDLEFAPANFATVAQGFGCKSWRVEDPGRLPAVLDLAFELPGPSLVDVVTDGWETPELALRRRMRTAGRPD